MASKNNRSYFRIDVMLPCSYRILSEEDSIEHPLPDIPDASYIEKYFMEDLQELDEQIKGMIAQISQKSNVLAQALTAINSKINFVLQTIDHKQLSRSIPMRTVNISGGGIAMKIDEPAQLSDKMDILLQPLPNETPILVRCNIIKITPDTDGTNNVALEYQRLSEEDRRKLVYFIQSKEIEYAQENKKIAID